MIEYFLLPAVVLGAAFIPKRKMKDEQKIRMVFENCKFGIQKGDKFKLPTLRQKEHKETYSIYVYYLPLGLSSEGVVSLLPAIEEALRKETEYEFEDGMLKLYVYNQKLPEKWNWSDELVKEGQWLCPIGKNHKGVFFHDFDKYPHMLTGGVTRYGKTVFLKNILASLLLNNPNDVDIYILDLKGGLEFHKYLKFEQVKGVACDVLEAAEMLVRITQQIKADETMFRNKGYNNVVDTPIKKRTFIIVDEAAELSPNAVPDKQLKKFAEVAQTCLSEIARISGGLGYRLILSTQYPVKEAVPMAIKANIVARVAFVCTSNVASRVLLDSVGAEDLPSIAGRCIYLIEKQRIVQVPYLDDLTLMRKVEGNEHARKNGKDIIDGGSIGNVYDSPTTDNSRNEKL